MLKSMTLRRTKYYSNKVNLNAKLFISLAFLLKVTLLKFMRQSHTQSYTHRLSRVSAKNKKEKI